MDQRVLFCIFFIFASMYSIEAHSIDLNSVEASSESHNIIDADPLSNSFNEHLASIVKLDAPIIQDGQTLPQNSVETPPEPTENSDLKADASGYYGYGSYRPPYYPYYNGGNPYHGAYWPYAGYYSRPSYPSYYPYGYRNNYYSGGYFNNPYRRPFSSFYY